MLRQLGLDAVRFRDLSHFSLLARSLACHHSRIVRVPEHPRVYQIRVLGTHSIYQVGRMKRISCGCAKSCCHSKKELTASHAVFTELTLGYMAIESFDRDGALVCG